MLRAAVTGGPSGTGEDQDAVVRKDVASVLEALLELLLASEAYAKAASSGVSMGDHEPTRRVGAVVAAVVSGERQRHVHHAHRIAAGMLAYLK